MKCPKCKNELTKGYLYCEHCGEEIKLVPEYEIQVESTMDENMKELLDEVVKQDVTDPIEHEKPKIKMHNQIFLMCCILLVLTFIIGMCVVSMVSFRYNSADVQHQIAQNAIERGALEEAIEPLSRAAGLEYENMEYKLELANIYWALENKTSTIAQIVDIMNSTYASKEDKIHATNIIIAVYMKSGDYDDIHQFIMEYSMQEDFVEYVAFPVTFQQVEGTYTEIVPLKLTTSGSGSIYYTLDGSIPTTQSLKYSGPIYLEKGEYLVTAIYENIYGVLSTPVSKKYNIDTSNPYPPEINVFSGVYEYPIALYAEFAKDVEVYYTIDGSRPTQDSNKYTGFIYVPEGVHNYRFLSMNEEGLTSSIISREITVKLDPSVSSKEAQNELITYCINEGIILNEQGYLAIDELQWYVYEYLYPITFEEIGDCYVFAEVIREVDQEQKRTGKYYAVDMETAQIYNLKYQNNEYQIQ